MATRPTLQNSCALAASAAELRFRIQHTLTTHRAARVIGLDDAAAAAVGRLAHQPWAAAHFLSCQSPVTATSSNGGFADIGLRTVDGRPTQLSAELTDADVAVMIATADDGAGAAAAIGTACTLRGIMTAGLILGDGRSADAAVAALRPHARVLIVSQEESDVSEVLTALRA